MYLLQEVITGLLASIPDGVILFDRDQKIIMVNPAATRLTGLPQEGFYLSEFTKLFKKRVDVDIDEAIKNALSNGVSSHLEEVPLVSFFYEIFISPAVEPVRNIYDISISSTTDPARNITGGVIVLHDITSLVEGKEKYRALLMGIGEGVIATNHEGNVVIVNQSAQDILGYKDTELAGKKLAACVLMVDEQGNGVPSEQQPIQLALSLGGKLTTITTTTYYYVKKNGTKIPVAITVTPMTLAGKIIGAIEVFRDITKEKEIDKVKREVEISKAKEEFLFRTIHDLRAPTNIIRLVISQYGEAKLLDKYPELKESLESIKTVNDRMLKLIDDLFKVVKGERAEIVLKKYDIDLAALIRSAITENEPAAAAKKVKVKYSYGDNMPHIIGDTDALKEVFSNLLNNATKYNKENGTITITHTLEGKFMKTIVQDTGIGISADALPKLFQPYFRAVGMEIQGTGLGLYIVKGLIEKMGGQISVESILGQGTTFTISLPAAK